MRQRLTREQRKEQTRAELVEAARRVFLKRGFHGSTLEEISLEAGYTTGAVYSGFGGKDELFLAVLDERLERRRRAYVDVALEANELAAAVRAVARAQLVQHEREPEWTPLLAEFWTHASRRDELRRAVLERHAAQLDALAALLEELATRHGVAWRLPAREVVRGTGALARGLGLERLLDPDEDLRELFEEMFVAATLAMARPAAGEETR